MKIQLPFEITKLFAIKKDDPNQVDTEINYAFAIQENFDRIIKYLSDLIDADNIIKNSITGGTDGSLALTTITSDNIAADTITANEIIADTITANEIVAKTITNTEIATDTITANEIIADTITANEIVAKTITNTEIATDTITLEVLKDSTQWADWTPTYSASVNMTFTVDTTFFAKYAVIDKTLFFRIGFKGTIGGTASWAITFTLPVNSTLQGKGACSIIDNDIPQPGLWLISSANKDKLSIYKHSEANWTLGVNREIFVQGFYEIA